MEVGRAPRRLAQVGSLLGAHLYMVLVAVHYTFCLGKILEYEKEDRPFWKDLSTWGILFPVLCPCPRGMPFLPQEPLWPRAQPLRS